MHAYVLFYFVRTRSNDTEVGCCFAKWSDMDLKRANVVKYVNPSESTCPVAAQEDISSRARQFFEVCTCFVLLKVLWAQGLCSLILLKTLA